MGLDGGLEGAVWGDVAVGHAGSAEGEAGVAVLVEEDKSAGAFAAFGKKLNCGLRGAGGSGAGGAQKVGGSFSHDNFHDGFAVAGGGNSAGFEIGVTAAADQRRIANAAGLFAASASGGRGGEETAVLIESDGADGALFVAAMMFGGVRVFAATEPRRVFGGGDEFAGIAEGNAVLGGEALGAFGDEHHVRRFFEDGARGANGIFDAVETGDGAGAKGGGVHNDGVAFDLAVEIEMGAETGVENGVVFENDDGGFDGVEGVTATGENIPSGVKSAQAAGFAGVNGIVGNVPGTTVNNERRSHGIGGLQRGRSFVQLWGKSEAGKQKKENGKHGRADSVSSSDLEPATKWKSEH